ncbi:MAG: S8 family serine peptidase [Anaerolineales bacterium]|nr:S8 family serine peptidase [Anaerolineales bacterium]
MKRFKVVVLLFVAFIGMFLFVRTSQANDLDGSKSLTEKVEAGLRDQVAAAGVDTYIVYLKAQADLSPAYAISDWNARGEFVYNALRDTAVSSQANLLRYLDRQVSRGAVASYESHFIVNAIFVTSDVKTLDAIARRSDVASVGATRTYTVPEPSYLETSGSIEAIEWGVDRIGAPQIWADFGTQGEGIVVANIDTGVDYTHPALVNQYRGASTGSHDYNFYDPAGVCGGGVCDNNDHGTHTMGTMVGDDGGSNQIGVAPGATWIAAKGCESSSCSSASLLSSAEWVLAPCAFGDAPGSASCDPAQRPNLVNNSWGGGGGDPWYQASVDAWQAAGIVPIFSAGNSGPSSGTIGTPGDYCNVVAVGATDINDNIASFSSRGPGSFAACQDKPDVSAPGANVRSSIAGGGYANFSGTSMAAPHTAGCTALLLSIEPGLTYTDIYDLLTATADDLGAAGFDYNFGYGRINCYAAALNLTPDFRLQANPSAVDICQTADPFAQFNIDVLSVAGFTDPVTLSSNPVGSFGTNPVTPPGSSSFTVDTSGYPGPGVFNVSINGSSTTGVKAIGVSANLFTARPGAAALVSPANGETDVSVRPTFSWTPGPQASTYEFAIATAPNIGSVIHYVQGLTTPSYTLPGSVTLDPTTTYYWTVRTNNPCGRQISAVSSFTTRAQVCSTPALTIPDGTGFASDSVTFSPSGSITDLDVYIDTTHSWVGDLAFQLEHVDTGTKVVLINRPGVPTSTYGCSSDDIRAIINDEGADGAVETTCNAGPALSGELVGGDPANTSLLSAFDGESFGGTWRLSVKDFVSADGGVVNEWCLIGATN